MRMTIPLGMAAGLSALLLAGCASAGAVAETTSPTPTPTASSAPAPATTDGAAVGSIVIGADAITVRDAAGGMARFGYFEQTDALVTELTAVIGSAPARSSQPGQSASTPSILFDWGTLSITDFAGDGSAPYSPNYQVVASGAEVDGIPVAAVDGVAVGEDATALASRFPAGVERYASSDPSIEVVTVRIASVPVPPFPDGQYSGQELALSVVAVAEPATGPVTAIRAPLGNFGH